VTGAIACFGLWGPEARTILQPLTDADLGNEAFPYMAARQIVVGDAPCLAARVTYVGELGWELYPSVELARSLWDTLHQAGTRHGLIPAGYRAIDSLRLEKGYRAWGSDITPEDTPLQAGLGFAVAWDKDFVGREALERQRAEGVDRRLETLTLSDPRAMCLGNEPVFSGGRVVSRVTSGGIGYATGTSVALAYLASELAEPGTPLEVEVFGERVAAVVAGGAIHDPRGERIRI
jgi:4-methylaminobutanoate oxidase (formaldehyde-forming)